MKAEAGEIIKGQKYARICIQVKAFGYYPKFSGKALRVCEWKSKNRSIFFKDPSFSEGFDLEKKTDRGCFCCYFFKIYLFT